MNNLEDIIKSAVKNVQGKNEQEFDVEEWAKEKNERKEWAYRTQDETAEKVVMNGEIMKSYLDVQSRFSNYSVGNALLITAQNPRATLIKDIEGWKKDKIYLKRNPQGITILEPNGYYTKEDGTEAISYDTKKVYDVSETQSKRKIHTIPYIDEKVLKAVLSISPVEVEAVENISNSDKIVHFNPSKRIILINTNATTKQMIKGLLNEISSIYLMNFNNSEKSNFENKCVSYMICRKYGIPTQDYDFSTIPEELKEMSAQEIKEELKNISDTYKSMLEGIDRTLDIPEKYRTNKEYER